MEPGSVRRTFHEFKWYNSHAVVQEVQLGILRLELPLCLQGSALLTSKDLFVVTQLICNQILIHESTISTNFAFEDVYSNAYVWDYVATFPMKFRDLSLDSVITFSVRNSDDEIVGGTTLRLFNKDGVLKSGKQKLLFFLGKNTDRNIIPEFNETSGDLFEDIAHVDHSFHMEKLLEKYKANFSQTKVVDKSRVDWLDRLTLGRIHTALGGNMSNRSLVCSDETDNILESIGPFGLSQEEEKFSSLCFLIVELPKFPFPVLFDEVLPNNLSVHTPLSVQQLSFELGKNDVSDKIIEFDIRGGSIPITIVADWEIDSDNIYEDMHRRLHHGTLRSNFDISIKPDKSDRVILDRIISSTGKKELSFDDMDILFRFRYSLTENKKALTKYLLAVDWASENEVMEVPKLLALWKEKAPIDISDALKLLGREKAYQHPYVREYAVEVLRSAGDEELLTYLLQLVQALRYEPINSEFEPSELTTSTVIDGEPLGTSSSPSSFNRSISPLGRFLIRRGCESPIISNFLYWYLRVEIGDELNGSIFQVIFDEFMKELSSMGEEGRNIVKELEAQYIYLFRICECQQEARDTGRKKTDKELILRRLLADRGLDKIEMKGEVRSIRLPLHPTIVIGGLNPATVSMFASGVFPCVIDFLPFNCESDNKVTHKVLIKSGDDLRQDQLIMQMISLMDSLLKMVNLDLKLLTYGILALSQKDGIMEFVTGSMPVSAILKSFGSITNYLQTNNPDENGPLGMTAVALDTYVKSCAGFCVITYILCIGDRHLDNVMIKNNGQFFHIDFGWIFGQDPKPMPPPFRLNKAMVDAMGGETSEHYYKFKTYCFQAYNWLRKNANLILNLLSLMGDAGINDISKRSDLATVLSIVESKFRLDLTDEEAEHFFSGLITEALTSFTTKVMELAHQFAVGLKQ